MRTPPRAFAVVVFAALATLAALSAGCGSSSRFAAICRSPDEEIDATATTTRHDFGLSISGPEITHTRAQVKAQGIKHGGDVLLAGSMVTSRISRPGSTRHFELHVCDRATGSVLTALHPVMRVADRTLGSRPEAITVATMEGTGEGLNDLHYGNDVLLQGGHDYAVSVAVGADRAVLPFHLPG